MAGVPGALGLGPGLQGGVTLLLRPSPSSHVSAVVGDGAGTKTQCRVAAASPRGPLCGSRSPQGVNPDRQPRDLWWECSGAQSHRGRRAGVAALSFAEAHAPVLGFWMVPSGGQSLWSSGGQAGGQAGRRGCGAALRRASGEPLWPLWPRECGGSTGRWAQAAHGPRPPEVGARGAARLRAGGGRLRGVGPTLGLGPALAACSDGKAEVLCRRLGPAALGLVGAGAAGWPGRWRGCGALSP